MVDTTNNNDTAINEVLNDLNLQTSSNYDSTIDDTQQQQINTAEYLIDERRRREEEEEEEEYQRSPRYEEPEEDSEYYMKDDNNDGIPDNEQIGTYDEEENVPDEFQERARNADVYGISEDAQMEAEAQHKASNKSEFRVEQEDSFVDKIRDAGGKISEKGKDFAKATAGFIGGFTIAKASSKSGKGVKITHKSKGKKAKTIEFGVRNPPRQSVSFPRAPSAPSPYGKSTRGRPKARIEPKREEIMGYNQNFDPIGFNTMSKPQENPFMSGNYRVTSFDFGFQAPKQPVKKQNKAKKPQKREESMESIFGIGSPSLSGDMFGFSFGYEKPKKTTKKSKKSSKKQTKKTPKQPKSDFESIFGFKL